jgi:hypothetical protein
MPNHVTVSARRLDPSGFGRHAFHQSHDIFADQIRHWPLVIVADRLITRFAPNA